VDLIIVGSTIAVVPIE